MNEQEKTTLNNILNDIMKKHSNNKRMLTIYNECINLLNDIYKGNDTQRYQLKISKHNGKMENLKSLSTYKLLSETCLKLKDNPQNICNKCYVDKTMLYAPQLSLSLIYNTLLLKYTKLKQRQLPIINDLYFRFESFSDLQNEQHLQNLYAIAKANPQTQFALWTKNIALLLKVKAPKNVNLILSSPRLNECLPLAESIINAVKNRTGCKNVKVFSVYDEEHIHEVGQNCQKHCITCLKCYKKNDKTLLINEHLK